MRQMSKIVALLVVIFMLAALSLTGCKSEPQASESTTTAKATGAGTEVTQQKLEAATIIFMVPGNKQKDAELVQEEWNKYLKEKINTELIINNKPFDTWNEKVNVMLATNEPMDLIFTASSFGYYTNVAKKAYAELDELIDQYAPDMKKLINPLYLEGPRMRGKLYMIPTNKEIADARAVWFRTDLLKKYNLTVTPDMTIEDFEPLFKVIKENEPGISPTGAGLDWYGVTKGLVENFEKYDIVPGYEILGIEKATGKVNNALELEWATEKYKIYRDYNLKGYFSKDLQEKKMTLDDAIRAGKLFSWAGMAKPGEDLMYKAKFNLSEVPTMVSAVKPRIGTFSTAGAGVAIVNNSVNKERAMMVINLLWSDEKLIHLMQDGIEGKHYIKDDAARFYKKLPDGAKSALDTGYDPGYGWQFGNDMLNLYWNTEIPDKHEQFQKFNESAYISPLMGFYFDPENVKTQIAALTNSFGPYGIVLTDGKVDPDQVFPDMLKKLKANGIDTVVADCQKQFDEWKSYKK